MEEQSEVVRLKIRLIAASKKAVGELIKVAEDNIFKNTPPKNADDDDDDKDYSLAADRLKNAAAAKKTAIFDAFDILDKVEEEEVALAELKNGKDPLNSSKSFAETHSSSTM